MTLPSYSLVSSNSQPCWPSVQPPHGPLSNQRAQPLRESPEDPMLIPVSHLGLVASGKEDSRSPQGRLPEGAQVQQRSSWDSARPMPHSGLEQRRAFRWPGWPRGP